MRPSSPTGAGRSALIDNAGNLAGDATHLRIDQLATCQSIQAHRQSHMGANARNLLLSPTTSIQRLESDHQQHDRRMQTHEQVIDAQQTQAETAIRTKRVNSRLANSGLAKNEEHLRTTQITDGAMMRRYGQAHRMWGKRRNDHEADTIRHRQQMQMMPNPPNASKTPPFNPLDHMPCPRPTPIPPIPPIDGPMNHQDSPYLPGGRDPPLLEQARRLTGHVTHRLFRTCRVPQLRALRRVDARRIASLAHRHLFFWHRLSLTTAPVSCPRRIRHGKEKSDCGWLVSRRPQRRSSYQKSLPCCIHPGKSRGCRIWNLPTPTIAYALRTH